MRNQVLFHKQGQRGLIFICKVEPIGMRSNYSRGETIPLYHALFNGNKILTVVPLPSSLSIINRAL